MYELEKQCWKEYLQKTIYRRNKRMDIVYIIGLSCIVVTTIYIFFLKKTFFQDISNKVCAIVFFSSLMFIYSFFELINNLIEKYDDKNRKEEANITILKNILKQNKCNSQNFLLFVKQEKSHTINKREKSNNTINIIFTFFLSLLFTLVTEENQVFDLATIFYIFVGFYCAKYSTKIYYNSFRHYDKLFLLEKTEEQMIFICEYKKDSKQKLRNFLYKIISQFL